MKKTAFIFVSILLFSTLFDYVSAATGKKIVIAHRGACGYLPEHSLEAKAMAYAMDVDYIEQDLVMTKDSKIVVLHDHYLDRVTNVEEIFPLRKRKDGRYYVLDFTLDEIKRLSMTEGFHIKDNMPKSNFSKRFPLWKSTFQVNTFEEEIELIQGLKTIKNEIFPKTGVNVKLVQLIAETDWNETMVYKNGKSTPYKYDWMFKKGAMEKISQYADGIGPWKPMIIKSKSTNNKLLITDMVKEAHEAGMEVHPYTFRMDKGRIPQYASSFEDMLDIFYYKADVDGVFTDFPDKTVQFLKRAEYIRNK